MRKIAITLLLTILKSPTSSLYAHANSTKRKFEKIKMMQQKGDKFVRRSVIVELSDDKLMIDAKNKEFQKSFNFSDIKNAEYSYSKNPRWKTGLGAVSVVFPRLLLVAIPLGFTKHRRHCLTIHKENDDAVLKLSQKNRKIFVPSFEIQTGVTIKAFGEDK